MTFISPTFIPLTGAAIAANAASEPWRRGDLTAGSIAIIAFAGVIGVWVLLTVVGWIVDVSLDQTKLTLLQYSIKNVRFVGRLLSRLW